MTFFKVSRLPVLAGLLCLLLMGFAGASYGAVRFDVVGSPTEVINTGRSEVVGSINLIVRGTGNITGTSTGGCNQIGIIYTNPAMQIDNTATTGIRIFFSTGFVPAFTAGAACPTVGVVNVENQNINGRCSGFITLNMAPGAMPAEGSFIRLEGVRGRIDASLGITPGTDLFADLQSSNDPSAATFTPDRVRVAKSLDGINVEIGAATVLLCFPSTAGVPGGGTPGYQIKVTEGFARAFVDNDANNDGAFMNDRVDSGGEAGLQTMNAANTAPAPATPRALGSPTNSTQFLIWLENIPTSVSGITWPAQVSSAATPNARLVLIDSAFTDSTGTATATYGYQAINQTGVSDITLESFTISPEVVLKANQSVSGNITAAVSLAPDVDPPSGCEEPGENGGGDRPRFQLMYESDEISTNNPPSDPSRALSNVVRCNSYLLFTYVTSSPSFSTGIVIANTTDDDEAFGVNHAPDQSGNITFYFYDATAGFVGQTVTPAAIGPGRSFVGLVASLLPATVTQFSGYIIAKAEFQFAHGFAYIADSSFASVAHGYLANVIADPSIKGAFIGDVRRRTAADAGDTGSPLTPSGEGLNN
jgi:hypothetical protein